MTEPDLTRDEANALRSARELEGHLTWLDAFTPAALGVLAVAQELKRHHGALKFASPELRADPAVVHFAEQSVCVSVRC